VPRLRFEYSPLELQSRGLASVELARKLMNTGDRSVLFGAVAAGSQAEAVELERRLRQLPTVASVESVSRFMAEDQPRKLALVRDIKEVVAAIPPPPETGPMHLPELGEALFTLQGHLGLISGYLARNQQPDLAAQLEAIRRNTSELYQRTRYGDTNSAAARLEVYQRALFADLRNTLLALSHQDDSGPLQVSDLPANVRNRFVGLSGRQLLRVYPRDNVWQREPQEKFVQELRTVAPDVIGTPVLLYEYLGLLSRSYRQAVIYSVIGMFVLIWFHFRSLTSVLLAILPVGMGTAWLLGLMGLFGIAFNPVNIMTLPLLVGIGVTNGIHILNRYAEERCPSMLARSTGKAVIISALTTMSGFGSLVLAKHQGIASLGYVMFIGVFACLVASIAFLPCLINLMCRYGWTVHRGTEVSPDDGRPD
jgi:hypothetical protein